VETTSDEDKEVNLLSCLVSDDNSDLEEPSPMPTAHHPIERSVFDNNSGKITVFSVANSAGTTNYGSDARCVGCGCTVPAVVLITQRVMFVTTAPHDISDVIVNI